MLLSEHGQNNSLNYSEMLIMTSDVWGYGRGGAVWGGKELCVFMGGGWCGVGSGSACLRGEERLCVSVWGRKGLSAVQ